MAEAPSPFSVHNPQLQTAWDATSMRALMFCPRYYQYSILEGWRGSSVDLEFGALAASAFEVFAKSRLEGKSRDEAQLDAVEWAICNSGHYEVEGEYDASSPRLVSHETWVPWGGRYAPQWHCTGGEPYKNDKGNKAKCPNAHVGVWHDGPAPALCGTCGSFTEVVERWLPTHRVKDRYGLVRMIAWYCEEQPEDLGRGGLAPYAFPDGTPGVELSFRLPMPWKTPSGETYLLCGHLDEIVTFGRERFISDNKTTGHALNRQYFNGYSPNIQVDIYDLAGNVLFPDIGLRGVMIQAAQLLQGGARFGIGLNYRTEAQREELLHELEWWCRLAEKCAADQFWPMNRAQCWLCSFKGVCSKDPAERERLLQADFVKRKWNPLEER